MRLALAARRPQSLVASRRAHSTAALGRSSSVASRSSRCPVAAPIRTGPTQKLSSNSRNFSRSQERSYGSHEQFEGDTSAKRGSQEQQDLAATALKAVLLLIAAFALSTTEASENDDEEKIEPLAANVGAWRDSLPVYTREEVLKHKNKENRIWVIFKQGVYDITDFIQEHPGQDKILMAAGGSIEPFWALYSVHNNSKIGVMLEELRIGNLAKADQAAVAAANPADPYANDPERFPALVVRSVKPFNAEVPPALLAENMITPNELFYVRNHLPVPVVDPKTYALEVVIDGLPPIRLTLDQLKKMPQHKVMATIQCAGNRRNEMSKIKPVRGGFWDIGAISNAEWTGVRLRDVLLAAGIKEDDPRLKHVQFEGLDRDTEKSYAASIPISKAMSSQGDVLLALQMNGKELPRDHGYPVRVVAPGIVGARNVKWLGKVIASPNESPGHWQQNDYKGFSPSIDWHNVDFKTAPAIQDFPVQSAITEPQPGREISTAQSTVQVKGYAWSGGGRGIVRVDVSPDGGKTWHIAELQKPPQTDDKAWAWTLWTLDLPVSAELKKSGKLDIVCKAVDASYNTQPERVEPIWNLRGVLSTAWHHVDIRVDPKK